MVILAAGGMAGVLSWVFTYPQEPFSNILLHLYIFQLHKYPSSRFSLKPKQVLLSVKSIKSVSEGGPDIF